MNEKSVRKNGSGDFGKSRSKQPKRSEQKKKRTDRVYGPGENSPSWLRRNPELREIYQRAKISEDRPEPIPITEIREKGKVVEELEKSVRAKKKAYRGLNFEDLTGAVTESQIFDLMEGSSGRRCLAVGFTPCGYLRPNGERWKFTSWDDVPIQIRWEFADDYDPKKSRPKKPTALESLTDFFTMKKMVGKMLSGDSDFNKLTLSRKERDHVVTEVTKSAVHGDVPVGDDAALHHYVHKHMWRVIKEVMSASGYVGKVKVQPNLRHFVSGDDEVTFVKMVPTPEKGTLPATSWDTTKSELQQVKGTRQLMDVLAVESERGATGDGSCDSEVPDLEDDHSENDPCTDELADYQNETAFQDKEARKWPTIAEGYDHLKSKMVAEAPDDFPTFKLERAVNPEKLQRGELTDSAKMMSGPIRPVLEWLESIKQEGVSVGISMTGSGLKMNVLVQDADPVQLSIQSRIRVDAPDHKGDPKTGSVHLVFFLAKRPPKGKGVYGVLNEAFTLGEKGMPVLVSYEVNDQQLPQTVMGELPQIEGALDSLRISFTNIL